MPGNMLVVWSLAKEYTDRDPYGNMCALPSTHSYAAGAHGPADVHLTQLQRLWGAAADGHRM